MSCRFYQNSRMNQEVSNGQVDTKELQNIGRRIKQSNGFLPGPMQRPGVDPANATHPLIAADMGVAGDEVVVTLIELDTLEAGAVVAVGQGEELPADRDLAEVVEALHADRLGVARQFA